MSEKNLVELKENNMKTIDMYNDINSFHSAWKIANTISKSDLVPTEFRNKPENCMIALDLCTRLSMSPFMIMQNIYVVHGKPSFSSKFAIAMINASGRFEGNLRFNLQGSGDNLSCYAYATYKGEKDPIKGTTVTIEMAKAEKWYDKNGSKWRTMPEKMIKYRAASFFANEFCADLLLGMSTKEELEDIEAREVKADIEDEVKTEIETNQASETLDIPEETADSIPKTDIKEKKDKEECPEEPGF